nr:unnamed protein product [Callosobruchus analis]
MEEKPPKSAKPRPPRGEGWSSTLNAVVCLVCVVSVSTSLWREVVLNSRLSFLEDRVAYLEVKASENVDNLVQRYRREAVYRLNRRMTRDLVHHTEQEVARTARETAECSCPAGQHKVIFCLNSMSRFSNDKKCIYCRGIF